MNHSNTEQRSGHGGQRHSDEGHRPRQANWPPTNAEAACAIRLEGVSKHFVLPNGRTLAAVHPTTLAIAAGSVFGLVGRSGAGKSTLLRLINLLERPDTGRVFVGGRELSALSRRELRAARQDIGMIFQQFNLLSNASVRDNVAFPLRIHGRQGRPQLEARVRACLDLVGIGDKIDAYPAQLSGGQKQRVAIARALASEPSVLLCDEPTSALDAETTTALLATLRDINAELGVTIVIVTHELPVVDALCQEVAVIENGAVAERFAPAALVDSGFEPKTGLGRELARLISARALAPELSFGLGPVTPLAAGDAPLASGPGAPRASEAGATLRGGAAHEAAHV